MKNLLILLFLTIFSLPTLAVTSYDRYGNRTGTYSTNGNTTTQYDRYGNRTGSYKTDSYGTTTTYDRYGSRTGS